MSWQLYSCIALLTCVRVCELSISQYHRTNRGYSTPLHSHTQTQHTSWDCTDSSSSLSSRISFSKFEFYYVQWPVFVWESVCHCASDAKPCIPMQVANETHKKGNSISIQPSRVKAPKKFETCFFVNWKRNADFARARSWFVIVYWRLSASVLLLLPVTHSVSDSHAYIVFEWKRNCECDRCESVCIDDWHGHYAHIWESIVLWFMFKCFAYVIERLNSFEIPTSFIKMVFVCCSAAAVTCAFLRFCASNGMCITATTKSPASLGIPAADLCTECLRHGHDTRSMRLQRTHTHT